MEGISSEEIDECVFEGKTHPLEKEGPEGKNPWEIVSSKLGGTQSNRYLITDSSDSDGLGCAVLLSHKYDDITVLPASNSNWGYNPVKVMKKIFYETEGGSEIFITDLGQNSDDRDKWFIWAWKLVEKGHNLKFRDHHNNDENSVSELKEIENIEYIWDQSKCATSIVYENDYPNAPSHLEELAKLTNVRDMFKTNSEKFEESEILSNAAFWFPFEHYVEMAKKHGPNLTNDSDWGNYIKNRSYIKEQKICRALKRVEKRNVDGISYGFIYGDCYQSEAGRRLLENYGCDIAIIGKPGGKISIRTTEEHQIADLITSYFDGGGHKEAAGASNAFKTKRLAERSGKGLANLIGPEIFTIVKNLK